MKYLKDREERLFCEKKRETAQWIIGKIKSYRTIFLQLIKGRKLKWLNSRSKLPVSITGPKSLPNCKAVSQAAATKTKTSSAWASCSHRPTPKSKSVTSTSQCLQKTTAWLRIYPNKKHMFGMTIIIILSAGTVSRKWKRCLLKKRLMLGDRGRNSSLRAIRRAMAISLTSF